MDINRNDPRIFRMKPQSLHPMSRGFQVYLTPEEWQAFAQAMADDYKEPVRVYSEAGVKLATVHPQH